ncbi:hypothetical protein PV327_011711, partial [Microctonus hyperodae]
TKRRIDRNGSRRDESNRDSKYSGNPIRPTTSNVDQGNTSNNTIPSTHNSQYPSRSPIPTTS